MRVAVARCLPAERASRNLQRCAWIGEWGSLLLGRFPPPTKIQLPNFKRSEPFFGPEPAATKSPTNAAPMSGSEPRKEVLSLAARPLFASQGSSSSLLFVDETAPKNQVERRKIRAHVSLNTHEAKRRQGLRGPREGGRRRSSGENATVENPLLDAPFANADPFDSLPVKKFPGMHDLIGYCK